MICISIGEPDVEFCKKVLQDPETEMAEIRLDGIELSAADIQHIFSLHPRLIATCRPGRHNDDQRKKKLIAAMVAGALYVDIEIEAKQDFKQELIQIARVQGTRVIISYHNHESTPSRSELERNVDRCFSFGADIAKIACAVHSESDSARLLSLYDYVKKTEQGDSIRQLVAIGMGEKGTITRVAGPLLGAPFTYASILAGWETAPGQLDIKTMSKIYQLINPQK
jgi:3-dehydroquinate dehydratase-1